MRHILGTLLVIGATFTALATPVTAADERGTDMSQGGRHLVVWHSNTTPQMVELFGGDAVRRSTRRASTPGSTSSASATMAPSVPCCCYEGTPYAN